MTKVKARVGRTVLKIFKWLLIIVFSFFLLFFTAFQFSYVQTKVAGIVLNNIRRQVNTPINLAKVKIGFFDDVILKNLYVEGADGDTLLFVGRLGVDIEMLQLLNKKVILDEVNLKRLRGNVIRMMPDSSFNFSFILDSLSRKKKQPTGQTGNSDWKVKVGEINLDDVIMEYNDQVANMVIHSRVGKFFLEFDEFNLQDNIILVKETALKNSFISYFSTGQQGNDITRPQKENNNNSIKVGLVGTINLSNTHLFYYDQFSSQEITMGVGELEISSHELYFPGQEISIDNILLANSDFYYKASGNKGQVEKSKQESPKNSNNIKFPDIPFIVKVGNIQLSDSRVHYDTRGKNKGDSTPGINYKNLLVERLNGRIENIILADTMLKADLFEFSFIEKNTGFNLHNLTVTTNITKKKASIDISADFNDSQIRNKITSRYPSVDTIFSRPGLVYLELEMINTSVQLQDMSCFYPGLSQNKQFYANRFRNILLDMKINGQVDHLDIQKFKVRLDQSSLISINGKILGLPDLENAFFAINLDKVLTTGNDIALFIPDTALQNVQLPAEVSMKGTFEGTMDDFATKIDLNTTQGKMATNMKINNQEDTLQFAGDIDITRYDMGALLSMPDTLGHLTLQGNIKGSMFQDTNIIAMLDVNIPELEALQYTYHGLAFDGRYRNNFFEGKVTIDDDNLAFDFDGSVNFRDTLPVFQFTLDLQGANLQALNLTKDDYRVTGNIQSDFSGGDMDDINGKLIIKDVLVLKNEKRYDLSSFFLIAENTANNIFLDINSDILDAYYKGSVKFSDLQNVFFDYLSGFFGIGKKEIPTVDIPRSLEFDIWIKDTRLLTEIFLTGLEYFEPARVEGQFDNRKNLFMIDADIPGINYNGNKIDSLRLHAETEGNSLTYEARFDNVASEPVSIRNISLTGYLASDTAYNKLLVGSPGKEKLFVATTLVNRDDFYQLHILPDQLIFNNKDWNIPRDNYIRFGKNYFASNSLKLSHREQKLIITTPEEEKNNNNISRILLDQFKISTFSGIVEGKETFLNGIINGNITLEKINNQNLFTSGLTIDSIFYKGHYMFDLQVNANNKIENRMSVLAKISGNNNNATIDGYYQVNEGKNSVNGKADLNRINLNSFYPLADENLETLTGFIKGVITVNGNLPQPDMNGNIDFVNAKVKPKLANVVFTLDNQRIKLQDYIVHLNNLIIRDQDNNKLVLDGRINAKNPDSATVDLNLAMSKFLLLNTSKRTEANYYGRVILDSDIDITGLLSAPDIQGSVIVDENTDFHYKLPAYQTASVEEEGLVEFVDKDMQMEPILTKKFEKDTSLVETEVKNINVTANITVREGARFKVIIDPVSNEELIVSGAANLTFQLDKQGKTSLSGRFEIVEGSYQLVLYNVLKRKFTIAENSYIVWYGNLTDFSANITAIYTVEASPVPLIANQTAGIEEEERLQYGQEVPFQVYLSVEGGLDSPEFSFDLQVPEGEGSSLLEAKLNQLNQNESELYKQIFSLLVFNGFVSEPGTSSSSSEFGLDATALSSLSKLLTNQLNRLMEENIEGLDFSLDVESYEEDDVARPDTRVEIDVSKGFFNQRLIVRAGGNLDVNQGQENDEELTNIAGDFVIEYKLTKEGTYRLKVFNINEYEDIIAGEITKTGVGFIFNQDFLKLKDIFETKKEKEIASP